MVHSAGDVWWVSSLTLHVTACLSQRAIWPCHWRMYARALTACCPETLNAEYRYPQPAPKDHPWRSMPNQAM